MSDLNVVCLIGRLTRDPELKYGATGTPICKMSLANNVYQGSGKEEKCNFFNVTVFGKIGENCDKYLKKGSQALKEHQVVIQKKHHKKKPMNQCQMILNQKYLRTLLMIWTISLFKNNNIICYK
jgi:single stranded DNA-binding protein